MRRKEFENYNIDYCEKQYEKNIISKYSEQKEFRYMWSKLNPTYNKVKIKIKANDNFYREIKRYIEKNQLIMIIDKNCIEDTEENIIIFSSSETILDILIENYWELDEVCITNKNIEWAIFINHNFEIYFVGDEIIKYYHLIREDENINRCIIK